MTPAGSDPSSTGRALAPAVHTALFFLVFTLSLSDQTFAARVGGLNVRFSQVLLAAVLAATLLSQGARADLLHGLRRHWALVAPFGVFLLSYAIAGALTGTPRSFVVLGWGAFNVSGAALLWFWACRAAARKDRLAGAGITLLALVILTDAFVVYVLGWDAPLLGHSQPAYYLDIPRPHAFHYEPAYAAAALCFGLFFLLIELRWVLALQAAAVVAAVLLTASRLGLMSLITLLAGLLLIAVRQRRQDGLVLIRHVGLVLAAAAVMLAVIFSPPKGQRYFDVITGPLSLKAAVIRVVGQAGRVVPNTPKPQPTDNLEKPVGFRRRDTSETERLLGWQAAIARWQARPVFGAGVPPPPPPQPGMFRAVNANTWLEILSEVGAVGLAAFVVAIVTPFAAAFRRCARTHRRLAWTALVVLAGHVVWGLNFCQTWPRLDFWLIYVGVVFVLFRAGTPGPTAPPGALAR